MRVETRHIPLFSDIGLLYGLLAALSLAVMAFLVHTLAGQVPSSQILLLRSLFIALGLVSFAWQHIYLAFRAGALPLWLRAIAGSIGIWLYYQNLQNTTAANATLLHGCSRLFIPLLAWPIFREQLTFLQSLGVVAVVLGTSLIYLPEASSITLSIFGVGMLGAFAAAAAYLSLRSAAQLYPVSLILLMVSCCSMIVSSPSALQNWVPLNSDQWIQMTCVALSAFAGHVFMTLSYRYLFAAVANAVEGSSILWIAVLEVCFLSSRPTFFELSAYLIVFVGTLLLNLAKARL